MCTARAISLATWKSIQLLFQLHTLAFPENRTGSDKKEQEFTSDASLLHAEGYKFPSGILP
jgi:hypothetical protein